MDDKSGTNNEDKTPRKEKSVEQLQREKLWKLKRQFRSGEMSMLDVSLLGEITVDFSGLPGIDSWRDLGNYEFAAGKWVFRERPPYTASDVALSDIYHEEKLISLRFEEERQLIEAEVRQMNRDLRAFLNKVRPLIDKDEKLMEEKWKKEVTLLKLTTVKPEEVHHSSVISINDLFSRPKEQPKIIIENLLAKGWIGLLAGASKSYKSWLTLQLALAVSKGNDWVGFQTQKSRVLYVDYELSHASIARRVAKICKQGIADESDKGSKEEWDGKKLLEKHGPQHGPDFLMLGSSFEYKNEVATILDAIRRAKNPEHAFSESEKSTNVDNSRKNKDGSIYRFGKASVHVPDDEYEFYSDVYDLIIIDPLYMLLGGRDENSATEMVEVFREIKKLQKATGAAILINTHFRKGPRDWRTSSSDRISGSGVFSRYPDFIITLNRIGEGMAKAKQKGVENLFNLDITLRHLKGNGPIRLTLHDFVFKPSRKDETDIELKAEASPRGPKKMKDKQILKYLRDNYKKLNGLTLAEIIHHMEGVETTVDKESGKRVKKFKRSTLYRFFQKQSDVVKISGKNRVVSLAFAERNER